MASQRFQEIKKEVFHKKIVMRISLDGANWIWVNEDEFFGCLLNLINLLYLFIIGSKPSLISFILKSLNTSHRPTPQILQNLCVFQIMVTISFGPLSLKSNYQIHCFILINQYINWVRYMNMISYHKIKVGKEILLNFQLQLTKHILKLKWIAFTKLMDKHDGYLTNQN